MFKHSYSAATFLGFTFALALGGCLGLDEVGGDVLVDQATDALTASAAMADTGLPKDLT